MPYTHSMNIYNRQKFDIRRADRNLSAAAACRIYRRRRRTGGGAQVCCETFTVRRYSILDDILICYIDPVKLSRLGDILY